MTLIWTQQMNLMKTKQHIINPKLEFCIGLWNWEGLILQQKYHFWPHMLHSQERDTYSVPYICSPEEKAQLKIGIGSILPEIDMRVFHKAAWEDFYGDVKEAIPDNAPEPRGKPITLRAFADSDHANDKVRRRSQTGFCFFINMACIIWYTK